MKTTFKAFALVLLSLPLLASAGNKISTGSMQVTFTVSESCAVQSDSTAAQRPAVSCQLNTPYQVKHSATTINGANSTSTSNNSSGAAIRTETSAQDWTIYF